jgi:ABC-2 type transport system permease protein
MSARGIRAVAAVERTKLMGQLTPRLTLAACAVGPFAFCVALRLQESTPSDTLFGRAVLESGFAAALVVLGFAALWVIPALASLAGGDLFSAEDRHRTWPTLLTRSRSRAELFVAKVLVALTFSCLAVAVLAVSSLVASWLVIGFPGLIDLSGVLRSPSQSLLRVALAWLSVVPPALGVTAVAILFSVATRSGAAGIGLPVVAALTMQLLAFLDGPAIVHRLLLTSAFGAWHGLLTEPPYYGPLLHGAIVSAAYAVVCLAAAYRVLQRRDFAR